MLINQNEHYYPIITMDVTEALRLIHELTAAIIVARGHVDGNATFRATEADGCDDEDCIDYTLVVKAASKQ